ncbi:MAG TPA: phosphate signaling complex protein PhoU [Ktedonobacteraceae bacterium]|nr:phosphate signaling complex protein PhoU [Ktedonobacteraceae bacterium]
MKRTVLDNDLQELNAQVIHLGTLVEHALSLALKALEESDQEKAGAVVVDDNTIDDLHLTIEEHALRILTLQQPLGGRDLRYLSSITPIAIDLERIGDEAEDIAQNVLHIIPDLKPHVDGMSEISKGRDYELNELALIRRLLGLGGGVHLVLTRTMKAFEERDAQAARAIWEEDRVVDHRHYVIQRDLMEMLEEKKAIPALVYDRQVLQRVTYLLRIAHELERTSDHCTNICERIVFIVEGATEIAAMPGD